MRSMRIIATVGLMTVLAAACTTTDPAIEPSGDGGDPSVAITSPSEGTIINGNVVELAVTVENFDIVAPDGDTSGTTGHFHVFIDQDPVSAGEAIGREAGIVHSADNPIVIGGLTTGEHTFTVVLGDGAHNRVGDAESAVTVDVEGPTVTASASVDQNTILVTAEVEGIELVVDPPSEQHLHFFLDTEPNLDAPIPTDDPSIIHTREASATFEEVEAGDHTIWVVVADADHVPLSPPVWAKATVSVS